MRGTIEIKTKGQQNLATLTPLLRNEFGLYSVRNYKVLADRMLKMIQLPNLQREMMGQKSREKVEREYDENIVIKRYLQAANNT